MVRKKARILGGLFIRKKYLNPNTINVIKKDITRKSLRKTFPKALLKLGIIYRVRTNGFVIKEFHNKNKATKFKKDLIENIKKFKKK